MFQQGNSEPMPYTEKLLAGLAPDHIYEVVGKADSEPLLPEAPGAPPPAAGFQFP